MSSLRPLEHQEVTTPCTPARTAGQPGAHDRLFLLRERIDAGEFGDVTFAGAFTGRWDGPMQILVRSNRDQRCALIDFWWRDAADRALRHEAPRSPEAAADHR